MENSKRVFGKFLKVHDVICQIDVSDNGKGMPEEELEGLPEAFPQTTRIGLYNIHKRLMLRYGKGLVIQSAAGVGTSVSFVIPPEGVGEKTQITEIGL